MKVPKETKKDIAKAINRIPLLSDNAAQIIDIINDPKHDLNDLVQVIKHDSSLTIDILRVANSALYGFPSEISFVEKAISLIGEEVVVNLTLAQATSALFQKKLSGYCAEAGTLWRHNLFTAITARRMSAHSFEKLPRSLCFTCGLLHDIGKAVISDFLEASSPKILKAIDQGKINGFQEAERRLLGMDHAQAGYAIAQKWQLPEALKEVIRYHHHPRSASQEFKPLVYCVHLSDIMAMMAGIGTGADTLYHHLDKGYKEYIDLTNDQLALMSLEVIEEFDSILEVL